VPWSPTPESLLHAAVVPSKVWIAPGHDEAIITNSAEGRLSAVDLQLRHKKGYDHIAVLQPT
jgi:hypothetical protein